MKLQSMFYTLFFILTCTLKVNAKCYALPAIPWIPSWLPERDDLLCDQYCEENRNLLMDPLFEYQTVDNCCTCHSCTTWRGQEVELFLEYVTVTGKTLVLSRETYNNESVYKIDHPSSELTAIPSNLCDWDNDTRLRSRFSSEFENIKQFLGQIVKIDLHSNKIRQLTDLNCMPRLDQLYLSNNRITFVSNTTFQYLSYLRDLDLSNNRITHLDPMLLYQPTLSVLYADFSFNDLAEVDVTNAITVHPFCLVDYSNNKLDIINNELDFKLNTSINYGLGIVSLADNIFKTFPDFKELFNLENLNEIGALFDGGFDFRDIQISCDCHLEPFRSLTGNITKSFWRDYHNVTCYEPEHLKGQSVFKVDPKLMVCTLTAESNCPRGCDCVDRSKLDTLYVDCSNLNLHELPLILPISKYSSKIALNVSGNHIRAVANRTYLRDLSYLDLSHNNLETIDEKLVGYLENASLDISNNRFLRKLAPTFQYRHLCSTFITNVTITCGCAERWIETWMKTKSCANIPSFQCQTNDGKIIPAAKFRKEMLDCSENFVIFLVMTIILLVIALVLSFTGLITYKYRYEILIVWLRYKHVKVDVPIQTFKWDIAITLDDSDDDVRRWTRKFLIDELTSQGYKVFLPYRDVIGGDKLSQVSEEFLQTRSVIVVLSENYVKDKDDDNEEDVTDVKWTDMEWKYAWHQYRSDKRKNLVIVNYDHISSFDMPHPQIRAFLRVGHTVEFGNHDIEVMDKILRKVGPSMQEPRLDSKNGKKQIHNNLNVPNEPPPDYPLYEVDGKADDSHNQQAIDLGAVNLQPKLQQVEEFQRKPALPKLAGPTIQDKVKFYNNEGMIK